MSYDPQNPDPLYQALKHTADSLARIRRHQMETERAGAESCNHLISTLHHARRGLPSIAECRRADGHAGLHEDEYGRRWRRDGLLVSAAEMETDR